MRKHNFINVGLHLIDTNEALGLCREFLRGSGCKMMFFLNAHCYNIAQKNKDYLNALNGADLLLNDGIGIKLGTILFGLPLKENMNGTDFIPKVIKLCVEDGASIYLVGSKEGVSDLAASSLKKKFPTINIVGNRSGYFNSEDEKEIIRDINEKKADVLVVGMGVPLQELWIEKNRSSFTSVKIALAGGAIIDFMSGKVIRAPIWIQKIGMEWFFRFVQEPKRLFRRYFSGNFIFFWHILKNLRKSKWNRI